jgi:hypothetical protein
MSVKDKVSDELKGKGTLSSTDVAGFTRPKSKSPEEAQEVQSQTTKVPVPEEAKDDPIVNEGNSTVPADQITDEVTEKSNNLSGELVTQQMEESASDLGIDLPDEVEVTPEDKDAFLDALIGNVRFERPFSVFGGKMHGILQNRLNRESRALLAEIRRRWDDQELTTMVEYSSKFRYAVLRFQLKEFQGKELTKIEGPLKAQLKVEDGEAKTIPPDWMEEAEVIFGDMNDGVLAALYEQLMLFERKYWAMVKNAANQNFWNPEDSTSA